jgi:hypothetical protein
LLRERKRSRGAIGKFIFPAFQERGDLLVLVFRFIEQHKAVSSKGFEQSFDLQVQTVRRFLI